MTTPRLDILGKALADSSRVRMLCELMEGRAYTNKELASAAEITPQTATAHLRLLQDSGLVVAEKSGRCVYHRLVGADVAQALEQMAAIAPATSLYQMQQRKAGGLADARSCYDHLAGPLAVALVEGFLARGMLVVDNGGYQARPSPLWTDIGVTLPERKSAQPFARACLDWTERKAHVAGPLGRQILNHGLQAGWLQRQAYKRGLIVTRSGRAAYGHILATEPYGVTK